jgi:hypothetical protein
VQVVRPDHVGELCLLELAHELAPHHFRNQKEATDAAAILHGDSGEFAEHEKRGRVEAENIHIRDDERPYSDSQFREELLGVGRDAHAPAF